MARFLPNADKIEEPLIFCTITGGDNGWFHVTINTSAKTTGEATAIAQKFVDNIFPGKIKAIRDEPEATEERDFERDSRIVSGRARFSFRLEDGQTAKILSDFKDGPVYMSFGR